MCGIMALNGQYPTEVSSIGRTASFTCHDREEHTITVHSIKDTQAIYEQYLESVIASFEPDIQCDNGPMRLQA